MARREPTPNGRALPSFGLPAWAVVQLDALLAAGVIAPEALDGLSVDDLTALARESIRTVYASFDPSQLVGARS